MNKDALLQVAIDCLRRDMAERKLDVGYIEEERERDARRLELLLAGDTAALHEALPPTERLAA